MPMDNLAHTLLPSKWDEFFFQPQALAVAARFILENPIQALFVKGKPGTGKTAWILHLIKSYKCNNKEEGSIDPCGVCPSCQVLDYRVSESTVTDVFWLQPGKDVNEGGMALQVRTALSAAEAGHTYTGRATDLMFIVCDEFHLFDPKIRQQFLNKAETPDPNSQVCYIFSTMDFNKLSDSERIAFPRRCIEVNMKAYTPTQISKYLQFKLDCPYETANIISRRAEGSIGLAISLYNNVITKTPDLDPEMAMSILSYANNNLRWKVWKAIFNYSYNITKLINMLDRILTEVTSARLAEQLLLDVYLSSECSGTVTGLDGNTYSKVSAITKEQEVATSFLRRIAETKQLHPVVYLLPIRQLSPEIICYEGVFGTNDSTLKYSVQP